MMLPIDPTIVILFWIGFIIYLVISGGLDKINSPSVKDDDEPIGEVLRRIKAREEKREEDRRYQKWLEEHTPAES